MIKVLSLLVLTAVSWDDDGSGGAELKDGGGRSSKRTIGQGVHSLGGKKNQEPKAR